MDGDKLLVTDPNGEWIEFKGGGAKGEKGDMPAHTWTATMVSFENPDGTWGVYRNLQGRKGDTGDAGPVGPQGLNGDTGNTGPIGL